MRFEYSEELEVQVGVYQTSLVSPLLFAIVVDVITENARTDGINEVFSAHHCIFMCETMENLIERFRIGRKV